MNLVLFRKPVRGIATIFALIAFGGCASSPPARFYTLSPMKTTETASPNATNAALVAIGPVLIPDYANRPEIVTVDGTNEVHIHEFHRWAGDLENNLSRVLVENLTILLPADRFTVVRWIPSIAVNLTGANRVMVDVTRMDGSIGEGGAAVFEASWVLYGPANKPLVIRKFARKEPVKTSDYKALAAALSQCVTEFSREIADAISAAHAK